MKGPVSAAAAVRLCLGSYRVMSSGGGQMSGRQEFGFGAGRLGAVERQSRPPCAALCSVLVVVGGQGMGCIRKCMEHVRRCIELSLSHTHTSHMCNWGSLNGLTDCTNASFIVWTQCSYVDANLGRDGVWLLGASLDISFQILVSIIISK